MHLRFVLMSLFLLAGAAAAQTRFESEIEHWRAATDDFVNVDDKNVALDKFHSFLVRYPKSDRAAGAQFMVGECYMALSRYESARIAYEKSLGKRGGETDYFEASVALRIGETYFNEGDYEKAAECFDRVVNKYAQTYLRAEGMYGQIRTVMAEERWTEFEHLFDHLVSEYAGYAAHPKLRFSLAFFRYTGGDYNGALPIFETIKTDVATFYTGRALTHLGRYIEASSRYRMIPARYPDSELLDEAAFEVGEAYYTAGQYAVAIQSYNDMLLKHGQSPIAPYAKYKVGVCQYHLGEYDDAIATFGGVVAQRPPENLGPLAQYMIGNCYLDAGQIDEAVFAYAATLSYQDSTDVMASAQFKIAYAYAERGIHDNAVVQAQRFLTAYPGHHLEGRARLVLAVSLLSMDRADEGQSELGLIMDRFPGTEIYEKALYLSSASFYETGQYDRVVTNYNFISKNLPPSNSEWRGRTYYYIGDCYYKMGQYENAAQFYERVLDGYVSSDFIPLAFEGMIAAYSSMEQYDIAEQRQQEYLRKLSAEGRSTTPNPFVLASIYFNQKDYETAIRLLEKFIAEDTGSSQIPRALDKLAWSLYRGRYYGEAIERWQELVRRHPDAPETPQALYRVGDTQFGLGLYEEAQATFSDFNARYSGVEDSLAKQALLRVGQCYANTGRTEEAITAFERVIAAYPSDPVAEAAVQGIQTVFYRSGRSLDEFVDRYPESELAAQALYRLGAQSFADSNYFDAISYLQRVMRDFPGSPTAPQALYLLAESYRMRGDYDQAVVTYRNFVDTYPGDNTIALARFNLGIAQNKAGDYLGSAETYEELASNTADTVYAPYAIWYAAINYAQVRKWDRLIDTYNRLLELFPEHEHHDDALLGIGLTYQNELMSYAEAVVAYERVLSTVPPVLPATRIEAQWHIGQCYASMKDTASAITGYEAVRTLGPAGDPNRLQALTELADMYQVMGRYTEAYGVYNDISAATADRPDIQEWIQQKLTYLESLMQTPSGG
jgi:TolA-binding protein